MEAEGLKAEVESVKAKLEAEVESLKAKLEDARGRRTRRLTRSHPITRAIRAKNWTPCAPNWRRPNPPCPSSGLS